MPTITKFRTVSISCIAHFKCHLSKLAESAMFKGIHTVYALEEAIDGNL